MNINRKYGKDIDYSDLIIIQPEDREKLQAFCCGNKILDNYIHNEIFEENYPQGLHFMVKNNSNDDDHCYLSDFIMSSVIGHIREIDEKYALVDYILLYADKDAERYYERNGFGHYSEFMKKEKKMEINENIPMYMAL